MKKEEINIGPSISFPKNAHLSLTKIENNSFWFNHRNKILKSVIRNYPFNGDFADIGGGNGFQLMEIAKLNKSNKNILIEPSNQGCMNAKKREIKEVHNVTFEDFDFDEYNIKGIGLFDVLEHIENDFKFLYKLLNKLKRGSRIYITVPAHQFLWSDVDPYGGHFRRYNKKMVKNLTNKLDANLDYFSYFFSYLLPISFLLRALPYKLGKRIPKTKLITQEIKQHNPQIMTKKIFNFFERIELNIIEKSKVKFGASCIFILKKN